MIKDNKPECISSFIDAYEENNEMNLITDILFGSSVRYELQKINYIDYQMIKSWCKQILLSLQYLHNQQPPVAHSNLTCINMVKYLNSGHIKISGPSTRMLWKDKSDRIFVIPYIKNQ